MFPLVFVEKTNNAPVLKPTARRDWSIEKSIQEIEPNANKFEKMIKKLVKRKFC